jgi:hypothetical protein
MTTRSRHAGGRDLLDDDALESVQTPKARAGRLTPGKPAPTAAKAVPAKPRGPARRRARRQGKPRLAGPGRANALASRGVDLEALERQVSGPDG